MAYIHRCAGADPPIGQRKKTRLADRSVRPTVEIESSHVDDDSDDESEDESDESATGLEETKLTIPPSQVKYTESRGRIGRFPHMQGAKANI